LVELLTELKAYDTNAIAKFYWSQPQSLDTEQFFSTKELGRKNLWGGLKETLRVNAQFSGNDICHFETLNFTVSGDKMVIPLKSYLEDMNESNLAAACLAYIVALASMNPAVYFVGFSRRPRLNNFRSRSILQSGTPGITKSNEPYTAAGLLGSGVIISIGDSGLDVKSCYFRDSSGSVEVGTNNKFINFYNNIFFLN
jgi:hypothetical protein